MVTTLQGDLDFPMQEVNGHSNGQSAASSPPPLQRSDGGHHRGRRDSLDHHPPPPRSSPPPPQKQRKKSRASPPASEKATDDHPLYSRGACRWTGCEMHFDSVAEFERHLAADHPLNDRTTAQVSIELLSLN